MRQQFNILVRVDREHAVNVFDAFESLLVPVGSRERQVNDFQNGSQAALRGERAVHEHVLHLGLDVVHEQVLHGQQFDLFARPIADVARLLHRSQTHGGSADAAGAGEGRFRGTTTRNDETQERTSRFGV